MTLTELHYLVVVAQERHFGRAAERACVTQPAMSLAIKKLEEELGTTIFERRRNGIELTSLGEQIVHQAQRVVEEAEHIKTLAAQGKDQLNGRLRFGVIATVGPYILPDSGPALEHPCPGDATGNGRKSDPKSGRNAEERNTRCHHGRPSL